MTEQKINAAIAGACGWTDIHDSGPWHNHTLWGYPPMKPGQGGNAYKYLPDYCTDLNAMHEAEQYLWRKDYYMRHDYVDELGKLLNPHNWQRMEASDMLDATARQRAEAFLKMLGKWEDGE